MITLDIAFFLMDKSDVFATFKSFVKGIHNEFETNIKRVRNDNGSVGAKSDQHINICSFVVRCDRMWPSTQ